MSIHRPVMVGEVIELLLTDPAGVYVDATVGGGGHAAVIARALRGEGRLIGLDRDPAAIELATARLRSFGARVELVHARASELASVLAVRGIEKVDGVLLDLGISSDQLVSARGFAFSHDGDLDLRFDQAEPRQPAHALLAELSTAALVRALIEFGDFTAREARRFARAVVASAQRGEVRTVVELRRLLEPLVPPPRRARTFARVFQTLRILVNDELAELTHALAGAREALRAGGVLCVISYHSLEDRIVKRFMAPERPPVRELPPPAGWPPPAFTPITRRALRASAAEAVDNPQARSARLRAARRR